MAKKKLTPDQMLADDMALFYDDPYGFVMYSFEWGKGELKGRQPEEWQKDFLIEWGEDIKERGFDGVNAVKPIRTAVASGHGIGKSALTSWIILFIMSTRPRCKGTVTANTSKQLETKTWAELEKWTSRCITGHWFTINSEKIYHNSDPKNWFCARQTCKEENSESFAGQHAVDSTSFYIFDEASAVPDKIWEVAEGGLTDGEPMFFAFGNPTRATGRFTQCFKKLRHRWRTKQIDSRSVTLTNKEQIQEWAEDWGDDSDFFRVRVKGQFPRFGVVQLISTETVEDAAGKHLDERVYAHMPVILGVDVAREGDDMHVIVKRQGRASWILGKYRHLPNETMGLANLVAQFEEEHNADAVFIDGVGVGGGVVDRLRELGHTPIEVNAGRRADDDKTFSNKRSEMWWKMREWLDAGGRIPDDQQLIDDLTAPEYSYDNGERVKLESKKDMKKRGLASPDVADAYSMTFAAPVSKAVRQKNKKAETAYNVLDHHRVQEARNRATTDYDILNFRKES